VSIDLFLEITKVRTTAVLASHKKKVQDTSKQMYYHFEAPNLNLPVLFIIIIILVQLNPRYDLTGGL